MKAMPSMYVAAIVVAAGTVYAAIDDPSKPWSYFIHPVTCIGMPLQTAKTGIQVTPEGTVFTGEHELALFFGDERKPLVCRQRRFVDDMPIIEDEWRDGDCHFRWTLFVWRGGPDREVPEHADALHPGGERGRQHRQQMPASRRSSGEVNATDEMMAVDFCGCALCVA